MARTSVWGVEKWCVRHYPTSEAIETCPGREDQQILPTVSHGVTYAAVCTYGCGDGRIAPTRCAVIDAGLDGRSSPHQACKTLPAGAGSAHSALVAGSGLGSPAAPGGSRRSRTTWPSGTTPCGDASLARSALGTHPCPLHSCPV